VWQKTARPWKLVSDGDLWEHFHKAATSKGAHAIAITWVKGHATQEHINKGITTRINKLGNDEADNVADVGTSVHGKDLVDAAERLHVKHNAYQKFMIKVSQHLVEGYLIHRKLTDYKDEQDTINSKGIDKKQNYKALQYPAYEETREIAFTSGLHDYQKHASKVINKQVHHFLERCRVAKCTAENRGISWVELYVLYRIRGYRKPIEDPNIKAFSRATADKQLKAFKKSVKANAKRVLIDAEDNKLFKANKAAPDHLKGVGILGKHFTLSFNVYVTNEEAVMIVKKTCATQ